MSEMILTILKILIPVGLWRSEMESQSHHFHKSLMLIPCGKSMYLGGWASEIVIDWIYKYQLIFYFCYIIYEIFFFAFHWSEVSPSTEIGDNWCKYSDFQKCLDVWYFLIFSKITYQLPKLERRCECMKNRIWSGLSNKAMVMWFWLETMEI